MHSVIAGASVERQPGQRPRLEGASLLIRQESLVALAASAGLVWLAQFHHLSEFGLYEDDYFFISEAMGKPPSYLLERLARIITVLPQGRPFGFFLPDLFSFIGDKLGGLSGIYVLGFLIVTLNTFLCYRLLRCRLPVAAAATGAAVFCLFPADTTKILLTHDFQLQPSLTFALLAGLAYAAGRRPLAYVLSTGALLSYENGFLALFGLPLLVRRWDRRTVAELARHVLSLVGVLVGVVAVRFAVGEGRATESVGGLAGIVPAVLGSLVIGPTRSLAALAYGPLKAVPDWDTETIALVVLSLAAAWVVLATTTTWNDAAESSGRQHASSAEATRRQRANSAESIEQPRSVKPASAADDGARAAAWAQTAQVIAAGLVLLILGYLLAFTHYPPVAIIGRGTSVHLGATLGVSVLAAGVAWALLQTWPRLAPPLIAAYLALAVGYYLTIDRDFIRSWQAQRAFWQDVAACCSDLQDGTVLLYELQPADETTFIFTNSWADPLVLDETFAFPAAWSTPPRLFSLTRWLDRVQPDGDGLQWWVPAASWNEHWEPLPQANVILLRRSSTDGHLQRVEGAVDVGNGRSLQLKPPAPAVAWPPAQLYRPLLQ